MIGESYSGLDNGDYLRDLAMVAKLSPLFSESNTPFIHSRFAERLFCLRSGNVDLARQDLSYDAMKPRGIGVGVKTFVSSAKTASKVEKVAEFTASATKGMFSQLSGEALAVEVSNLRNARILSDAAETGISVEGSYYHCVVRVPNGVYLLEQPYGLVHSASLSPTDKYGKPAATFSSAGHVYFNDGFNDYVFNVAKNVLYKRFSPTLSFTTDVFDTHQIGDLEYLLKLLGALETSNLIPAEPAQAIDQADDSFVVLPLYSAKDKTVAKASGINQWNAAGRVRTFGEAYIPVPRAVHDKKPGFFPAREVYFKMKLPNGSIIIASICQDGDKALMSKPNIELCKWLFSTIDGSYSEAERRLVNARPYLYSDLKLIGKDSVRVTKVSDEDWDYEIQSAPLGSYEDFLEL